jgi:hypothetical protein
LRVGRGIWCACNDEKLASLGVGERVDCGVDAPRVDVGEK